jgi:diguanylate cyclase (GGDEF)-like protein
MVPHSSPISLRLVVLGVVLVGAIAVAAGLLVASRRNDVLAQNQAATGELAQVLAEQTSRTLEPVDLMLRTMQERLMNPAGQAPASSWPSEATFNQLTDQLQSLPQVDALIIIGADGRLANYTRKYPPPPLDLSTREYYRYFSTQNDHGLYVSAPVQTYGDNIWTVYLARRVNDGAGGFAGIAAAAVTIAYLEDFYRAVTPKNRAITLLRRDGTILGRYPVLERQQGFRLPVGSPWYRVVSQGGGTYLTPGYLAGQSQLVSVRPLRDFPLVIDAAVSETVVLSAWRVQAGWLLTGAGFAAAVVISLLWVFGRQLGRLEHSKISLAQQNAQLERGRRQFDAVLDSISQGLTFFDRDQRLMVSNRRYAEIYRLTPEQTRVDTSLSDILDYRLANNTFIDMTKADFLARRAASVAAAESFDVVDQLSDGRLVSMHYEPLYGGGWVTTHEDITERCRVEASLAFMARHDALTELPNRVLFRERLEQAIAGTGHGSVCALLCLDLDRFKVINDTLGHPVGDGLLRAVAARLLAAARAVDTVARLGGDEFAIIQAGLKDAEHGAILADRILASIRQPFEIDGNRILVAVSIGISIAHNEDTASETLMKNADIALYLAKSQGRGTYRFFRPEMDSKVQELRAVEMELRNALPANDFELEYQPIMEMQTEAVTGFEALLRWNHPVRGRISPLDFIPIAEETGLIVPIGDWVLRTACQAAAAWPEDIDVAINLSSAQFNGAPLFESVQQALAASGLAPTRLVLEITESVLLQNSEDRLGLLHRFRALGIRIALDDFGTGFSSLSYLRSFPFDKIKVDKSFVCDVDTNKDSTVIVAAIIGLARSLGMATVAEGVETEQQLAVLRDQGCDRVQGYLFSRPVPVGQVPGLIRALRGRGARWSSSRQEPAGDPLDRVEGGKTRALPWTRQGACPLEPTF